MSPISGFSVPCPPQAQAQARLARLVTRLTVALWVPVVLAMGAYLLGGHLLSLPTPTRENTALVRAVAAIRAADGAERWVVLHVLYEDCRCSSRVLDHLLARGADPSMVERIVFVETSQHGGPPGARSARALARGFAFERISADDLDARYGVQAAPLLVISDSAGTLRYVGGYSDRKGSPETRDREIVRALRSGEAVAALPVFGCPVSKALDDAVDPFGLRR